MELGQETWVSGFTAAHVGTQVPGIRMGIVRPSNDTLVSGWSCRASKACRIYPQRCLTALWEERRTNPFPPPAAH